MRTHDQASFFKYVTASTGRIVVKNQSFRWSAPKLFNDPFDVPTELARGISARELHEAAIDRMVALVRDGRVEDERFLTPNMKMLVSVRDSASPDVLSAVISDLESQRGNPTQTEQILDELRQSWTQTLDDYRILCLSATPSSAAMWNHYADAHHGMVIEVACSEELDSPWLKARRVNYSNDVLHYQTAQGWADCLLYSPEFALGRIFHEYTHTKTLDWNGEEEWRVVCNRRPGETEAFADYPVDRRHFIRLYFGVRMEAEVREELIAIAKAEYPSVELLQAIFNNGRTLSFQSLSIP